MKCFKPKTAINKNTAENENINSILFVLILNAQVNN